ncbi:MAG: rhamnogalacturonan lyase, partial [Clostridia bacterium]|nr:rhamnogalacturonan lyase [Clostridia bacterium]
MIVPFAAPVNSVADEATPRIMEKLDRGLIAAKVSGGVYLSWRLLGTESLSDQAFDIYRNNVKIHTTGVHDATCYTDAGGTEASQYIVVPKGEATSGQKAVTPMTTNVEYSNGGFSNSVAYKDIPFTAPDSGTTPDGEEYTYTAGDMSVGDLDGDGEYEFIVKWDPSNAKDNSATGYTGNVYIDAYETDGTRLWRIDLGKNIRAGAHYTQFLVYDFDCDGKAEMMVKTADGTMDGTGNYIGDSSKDYRSTSGTILSGPEYLTVFNGETGAAMKTVDYSPPRSIMPHTNNATTGWGDTYGNRCERYLAGVAYLDGIRPSAVFTRGYYTHAYAAAYSWDGSNLTLQWLSKNNPSTCTVVYANGSTKTQSGKTLYGQGAHSVSVADVDNDGCDELIFGSAVLDNDGTVLMYDGRGHGDAEHVSDFDNDGKQEIFFVHEAGKGSEEAVDYAVDIKRYNASASSGTEDIMLQSAVGDIGRGIMTNVDDTYAKSSGSLALFWSTASGSIFNQSGEAVGTIPSSNSNFMNFAVYWDGDLSRELLDDTKLAKYTVSGGTTRIYYARNASTFPDVSANNSTKATPALSADIFGDWREEIIYRLWDGTGVRIYMSTIPTTYRLTTLMHESQYRCAVAWQNVGYN